MKKPNKEMKGYALGEGINIETETLSDISSEDLASPTSPTKSVSATSPVSPSSAANSHSSFSSFKSFLSNISDTFSDARQLVAGKEILSTEALTPAGLNFSLCEELENQCNFYNIRPAVRQYEQKQYLMYKDGVRKVMFVPQSCCDATKGSTEFILGGERSLIDAINDVRNSKEYQRAKDERKVIEMHTPLSITKSAYGIKRAHWVTAIIEEQVDNSIQLSIMDSMGTSLGYNFDHIEDELNSSVITTSTEENPNDLDDEAVIISSPSIRMGFQHKSDQGLHDHTSCGHYVIKYITEHAKQHFNDIKPEIKHSVLDNYTALKPSRNTHMNEKQVRRR